VARNVSVDTGPSRYTQNISIAARSLVIEGQLRFNHTAFFEGEDMAALDNCEPRGSSSPMIIGTSAALQRVLGMVRVVGPTDATVLINGETGTGKELASAQGLTVELGCRARPAPPAPNRRQSGLSI
jgi:transcriptional regulator with GAF, ATPase, and Fis domain